MWWNQRVEDQSETHRSRLRRSILYRPVSIRSRRRTVRRAKTTREGHPWRSWTRTGRSSRSPSRWSPATGARRAATSTPTSSGSRPTSCGPAPGRWRAGSRRSRSRSTSSTYDDPRPVGHRRAAGGRQRHRRPERLPPPGRPGRPGPGHVRERVHLPVPRVVLRARRARTPRSRSASSFSEHNLQPGDDIDLRPVRCETWGGCAWINLDDDRPAAARLHRAVRHDHGRLAARVDAPRVVVRLPPARELEARRRGVHGAVPRHRVAPAARRQAPVPAAGTRPTFDPQAWLDAEIRYLHIMNEGMAGMVHARDVDVAEGLRDIELPAEFGLAVEDLEPHAQRRRRAAGTGTRATRSPTSTSSRRRASTSRWATASPTSSCCRCTAAPRRTGSGRSGPRRR